MLPFRAKKLLIRVTLNEETSVATILNLVPDSTYRGRIAGTRTRTLRLGD